MDAACAGDKHIGTNRAVQVLLRHVSMLPSVKKVVCWMRMSSRGSLRGKSNLHRSAASLEETSPTFKMHDHPVEVEGHVVLQSIKCI